MAQSVGEEIQRRAPHVDIVFGTHQWSKLPELVERAQEEQARAVEIDFYGSGGTENKAKLQLRHAYMKLDWPADDLSVIAGQTSDVFSPLNPSTLNYTVLWDAGNIGYRRPQIRLGDVGGSGDTKVTFAAAATRPIGGEANGV